MQSIPDHKCCTLFQWKRGVNTGPAGKSPQCLTGTGASTSHLHTFAYTVVSLLEMSSTYSYKITPFQIILSVELRAIP